MVNDNKSTINQQINSIISSSMYNSHFLYYAFQPCRLCLEQAAAKVTVPILNKSNFINFQIATPSREDQEVIAEQLSVIHDRISTMEEKAANLKDLFHALLHRLMTAKPCVRERSISE